jgi:hypothetical protein
LQAIRFPNQPDPASGIDTSPNFFQQFGSPADGVSPDSPGPFVNKTFPNLPVKFTIPAYTPIPNSPLMGNFTIPPTAFCFCFGWTAFGAIQ